MRSRRLADLLRAVSEHRWFPLGLGLFAVALVLPSLGSGLFQDDLVHRANLVKDSGLDERYYGTPLLPLDSGTARGAMRDMFAAARTPEDVERLKALGLFPWWTYDRLRVSNWRPLTALTHWLDYRLFPRALWLMHVHNVLWFGAVAALVAAFYRRMMGAVWVAGLAAILYVVDESNYFPVRWLANRNLLMALFFSLLALRCHDQWRRHGKRSCAVAAPVLLLLALLSTEAGIATFAYLLAYALVMDRGGKAERLRSLVPAVLVIVGWRLVYSALGHGASGGGFVIDPAREPLSYASAVLERAPLLLVGQWSPLPAETYWLFSEHALRGYMIPAYAFLMLVLFAVIALLKTDRVSRFWCAGMLLCVLPVCATVPMNRNLLFIAIGGFALAARYAAGMLAGEQWVPKSRLYRVPMWIFCIALLFIHVPFALLGRIWSHRMFSRSEEVIYATVDIGDQADLPDKTVVVVNAPNPFLFVGLPHVRSYEGRPSPKVARVLVPGWRPLEITRTAERTLVVRSQGGSLLSADESRPDKWPNFLYMWRTFNKLFRGKNEPFRVGERVSLPEVSVEVLSVALDGFPDAVQFEFALALEDASLRWLQWDWKPIGLGSYSEFAVPAIGRSVTLAGAF